MNVLFVDPFGDCLDLVLRAREAGHKCVHYIAEDKHYGLVGNGLTNVVRDFKPHLADADLIFLADNTKWLHFFDRLRADNPRMAIFGATWAQAQWENDRLLGMKVLEDHGIECPKTRSFDRIAPAIAYTRKHGGRLVCKPCGDADKSLSYLSSGPDDMEFMLGKWEKEGKIRDKFVLQDFIEGTEFAVGTYVGRNGFAGGFEENFEHKKLGAREIGPNTGEMGTVLLITDKSKAADMMLAPLEKALVELGFSGDIDVNFIVDEKGKAWPLEFTCRPGYPALQIQAPLFPDDPIEWMYDLCTKGTVPRFTKDVASVGVALCMPPFPYEAAPAEIAQGFPVFGLTPWNRDKVHPYHIQAGDITEWMTAGQYALVVTGTSEKVSAASDNAYRTLKQLVIPGSPIYRHDIGDKLAKMIPKLQEHGFAKAFTY